MPRVGQGSLARDLDQQMNNIHQRGQYDVVENARPLGLKPKKGVRKGCIGYRVAWFTKSRLVRDQQGKAITQQRIRFRVTRIAHLSAVGYMGIMLRSDKFLVYCLP